MPEKKALVIYDNQTVGLVAVLIANLRTLREVETLPLISPEHFRRLEECLQKNDYSEIAIPDSLNPNDENLRRILKELHHGRVVGYCIEDEILYDAIIRFEDALREGDPKKYYEKIFPVNKPKKS